MYCPKCAEQNSDEAKFCRGCGEDLTIIAQAMSKHLPVILVGKLDEHIAQKNNRLRRDGVMTGLSGVFLLLSGIWQITAHPGVWVPAVFMLVGALILLMASAWDMLAYKRSSPRNAQALSLPPTAETGELEASSPRQIPPISITEQTTRHLDTVARPSGELP